MLNKSLEQTWTFFLCDSIIFTAFVTSFRFLENTSINDRDESVEEATEPNELIVSFI